LPQFPHGFSNQRYPENDLIRNLSLSEQAKLILDRGNILFPHKHTFNYPNEGFLTQNQYNREKKLIEDRLRKTKPDSR